MLKISNWMCGALLAVGMVGVPSLSAAGDSTAAADDKASVQALEMRFRDAFIAKAWTP